VRTYELKLRTEFPSLGISIERGSPSWNGSVTLSAEPHYRKRFYGDITKELYLRWAFPYGSWTVADGEVLFNREYRPIWQRRTGEPAQPIDPIWIEWIGQRWFYDDGNPPWCNRTTLRKLEEVLARFKSGKPVTQYFKPESR
jgi:hypothetical protein